MIEKIKQNPIKVLGIAAGIFFIAAILFMLLPGIRCVAESEGSKLSLTASLFAFVFGGKSIMEYSGQSGEMSMRVNGMIVVPVFLFGVALILAIILVCGLFKGKLSKKQR